MEKNEFVTVYVDLEEIANNLERVLFLKSLSNHLENVLNTPMRLAQRDNEIYLYFKVFNVRYWIMVPFNYEYLSITFQAQARKKVYPSSRMRDNASKLGLIRLIKLFDNWCKHKSHTSIPTLISDLKPTPYVVSSGFKYHIEGVQKQRCYYTQTSTGFAKHTHVRTNLRDYNTFQKFGSIDEIDVKHKHEQDSVPVTAYSKRLKNLEFTKSNLERVYIKALNSYKFKLAFDIAQKYLIMFGHTLKVEPLNIFE